MNLDKNNSPYSFQFINHASIQILHENLNILFDPWYWGTVFNDSWSLLVEGHLNLKKSITHIFISHEHPDHLSFGTLARLKSEGYLSKNCTVYFPYRKENSIKNVILKLGLEFKYIHSGKERAFRDGDIVIAYYSEVNEGDHSIIIKTPTATFLNQNDHYPNRYTCQKILADWEKIDVLLTQFSLAGYYGNKSNPEIINNNGHLFHLNRINMYSNFFKPKFVCPFASFVYFCDEFNFYLNKFIVTPKDIKLSEHLNNNSCLQLLMPGDPIILNSEEVEIRNRENLNQFNKLFYLENKTIQKSSPKNLDELMTKLDWHLKSADIFHRIGFFFLKKSTKNTLQKLTKSELMPSSFINRINQLILVLSKMGWCGRFGKIGFPDFPNTAIQIDFFGLTPPKLVSDISHLDFKIPSKQFEFAMKFPWGADTSNISGTLEFFTGRGEILLHLFQKNNNRI